MREHHNDFKAGEMVDKSGCLHITHTIRILLWDASISIALRPRSSYKVNQSITISSIMQKHTLSPPAHELHSTMQGQLHFTLKVCLLLNALGTLDFYCYYRRWHMQTRVIWLPLRQGWKWTMRGKYSINSSIEVCVCPLIPLFYSLYFYPMLLQPLFELEF